jgi:hypothetical protein
MAAQIFPTLIHNGPTTLVTREAHLRPDQIHEASYNITSDVLGNGTYNVMAGATLGFIHLVNTGQTINLWGEPDGANLPSALLISDPSDFQAHVVMNYTKPLNFHGQQPPGSEAIEVGISMLGRAVDSWSYHTENHSDTFQLWSGKRVVESLHLTVNDPYGITVQAAPGGWIYVSANDRTQHGIGFLGSPASLWHAMPVHV